MGSNLVIAAIPDENDRVWKVSSEKIPHLTIMHLGDSEQVANLEQIMLFVEHAATTSLKCFYLPVDRRGELGEAKADVLFFKKRRYDFQAIRDFRNLLLQDQNIKTAYDAATQFEFPEHVGAPGQPWIPHLTLGYPETPAKPEPDDFSGGFYSVEFNRIAVWTGDFEGPDWRLKDFWDEDEYDFPMDQPMSVAMSGVNTEQKDTSMAQTAELGAEFIEHYGTKGMKWGVRNYGRTAARVGIGTAALGPIGVGIAVATHPTRAQREAKIGKRPGAEDRLPKLKELPGLSKAGLKKLGRGANKLLNAMGDNSWEKSTYSDHKQTTVHNKAAEHVDSHLRKLQDSPKYAGKNLLTNKKLKDSYDEDVAKVTQVAYRKAVTTTYGSNVTNTKVARFAHDARGPRIEVREKKTGNTTSEARLSSREEIQKRTDARAAEIEAAARVSSNPQSTSGSPLRHAAEMAPDITIPVKVDKNGLIVGLTFVTVEEDLAQTADLGAEWLSHYGTKGMKWGVRRERGTAGFFETKRAVAENKNRVKRTPIEARVQDSIGTSGKKKTTISSKGGEDHPATPDAIRVAASTQKLKKSGTHALSNKELQEVATRLNLEAQVSTLTKGNQSMGKKFIDGVLGRGSKEDRKGLENKAGQSAADAVGKQITKKVVKKVATGGLA